ncbi:MAG TPA: glycosyltransferase family 4 protein [Mycobacteriales bacterium]|nr:glycosyltransferase family 4 protein [Mycobacteriales bacterium]HWC34259.1 glycosyltransferase family 4 protein [Mycobacteriales bacterium]
MRVLVLTNLYPPHALGGYELSCQDTVERWREAGHDVTVLTTTTTFHDPASDPPEPHVRRRLEWYWTDHHLQRPEPRHRLRIERHNQRRLLETMKDVAPDVVSVWAMGGMSVGLLSSCIERAFPVVAVIEDDWLVYASHVDAWTAAWSRRPRWLGALASQLTGLPTGVPVLPPEATVAFASDYLRRRAEAEGTIRFSRSAIVPLGTDPVDFPSRRPGDRPWQGRLLMVGRVEPRKGFDIAIQALADLPGATLRIVGAADDRHRDELIAMAREIGVADRLTCEGFVERDQLAAVYAEADALLFLSRWDEPFGLVPLEAMTQALPVIAIRRGGAAEYLTDNLNCVEVPVDDPPAVAAAVRALAADGQLRRRLVNGGLTTSAAYRVDRFASELEAIHLAAAGRT